jgi:diaminopropionate ammonia-lyase
MAFHATFPGYAPTPLVELPPLATGLDVGRVCVKDESSRLRLPAFKVLGVSWGVFRTLAARADEEASPATLHRLRELADQIGPLELVTATDGNHGRALAHIATMLRLASHVFVPDDLSPVAIQAIEGEGASVTRIDGTYDDAVRLAARYAGSDPARMLIQDTAWEGYMDIPAWIIDGYGTLFQEARAQLREAGIAQPDLIVIPTGVGSLLQAAITFARSTFAGSGPAVLSVEPASAACVLASLEAGTRTQIATRHTVMAGLNAGAPSLLAWPAIAQGLDAAVAVDDGAAREAMAELAALGIVAGPCGSASLAGARALLSGPGGQERRDALGIGPDASVLLVSTDGRASVSASQRRVIQ